MFRFMADFIKQLKDRRRVEALRKWADTPVDDITEIRRSGARRK